MGAAGRNSTDLSDFEVTKLRGHGSIANRTRVYEHLQPEKLAEVLDEAVVGTVT
jgi:site-specific recombinase XerC